MRQVNMLEAKSNLSRLVSDLENRSEDIVYIARNGRPVVMLTLIPEQTNKSRFGVAEGVFRVPDEFFDWDQEIEDMFEEAL